MYWPHNAEIIQGITKLVLPSASLVFNCEIISFWSCKFLHLPGSGTEKSSCWKINAVYFNRKVSECASLICKQVNNDRRQMLQTGGKPWCRLENAALFLNCHKKLLLIFPVLYATTPLMLLLHYQPTSWMKTPFIGNTGGLPRLGAVSTACPLISTWKERWIRHCVTVFRKVSVGFRKYFNFLKLLRWAKLVNWGWDLWCRTTCYSK